ncbi:hypothetical protein BGZ58_008305, partial [Dissophora ornata]
SKPLDGLPFIRFAIEGHQNDDAFNSFFIPPISTTELMAEDWLARTSKGENTDNDDYILEIKPELQATSEKGSPLKPKLVRKLSRIRSYHSMVEQLASLGPSSPDYCGSDDYGTANDDLQGTSDSESAGGYDTSKPWKETPDIAERGRIHNLLSVAANFMVDKKYKRYRHMVTYSLLRPGQKDYDRNNHRIESKFVQDRVYNWPAIGKAHLSTSRRSKDGGDDDNVWNNVLQEVKDAKVIAMDHDYHDTNWNGGKPTKKDLLQYIKNIGDDKTAYTIYVIAAANGHHRIFKTPPYHCELQPIEKIWAVVKSAVAANMRGKMKTATLKRMLDRYFTALPQSTFESVWRNSVRIGHAHGWEAVSTGVGVA